jgi:pyruvate-formate lyase-activating enzyme
MRTLDFRDHRRELDQNRYVYAVVSRRSRGLSIGINLNPDKVCNFDCPYCQVDRRTAGGPREVELPRLEAELNHLLHLVGSGQLWELSPFNTAAPALRRVNDIAFAGDGEPTSATVFPEAVSLVGALRRAHGLESVRVHLLTNATLLHRPRVREGLRVLDEIGGQIWAKLDAGTEAWFQRVDGTKLPFSRVLQNLLEAGRARPIVLQCLFPTWEGEGPDEAEVDAWQARIAELLSGGARVLEVQVYSVARAPADGRIGVLPASRLEAIAARARALGLHTVVYPGVEPAQEAPP